MDADRSPHTRPVGAADHPGLRPVLPVLPAELRQQPLVATINDRLGEQIQQPLVTNDEPRKAAICRWKAACLFCTALAVGLAACCVTLYLYDRHIIFSLPSPPSSPPSPPPYFKPIVPTVMLNNGVVMPMISLGTWDYKPSDVADVVRKALQAGFSHIDTAWKYGNQAGVGAALAGRERETTFLTTKVWPNTNDPAKAYDSTVRLLHDDLADLNMSYVDLMLMHWPVPYQYPHHCEAMQEGWRALEDFYKAGKARAIG